MLKQSTPPREQNNRSEYLLLKKANFSSITQVIRKGISMSTVASNAGLGTSIRQVEGNWGWFVALGVCLFNGRSNLPRLELHCFRTGTSRSKRAAAPAWLVRQNSQSRQAKSIIGTVPDLGAAPTVWVTCCSTSSHGVQRVSPMKRLSECGNLLCRPQSCPCQPGFLVGGREPRQWVIYDP